MIVDRIPGPVQRKFGSIPIKKIMPIDESYDKFEKKILKIFIRRGEGREKNVMRLAN